MAVDNREIAALLERMGQLKQVLGADRFRVTAYERAARAVGELGEPVDRLIGEKGEITHLTAVEGIGKKMAQRIAEYVQSGRVEEYDELMQEVPEGVLAMLDVPGLGPSTVRLLWQQAGLTSLDELKKRLETDPQSLAQIKGLGEKTLENVRQNLAFAEQAEQRVALGAAVPLAQHLAEQVAALPGVKQAEAAGSLRRGRETVGDLDLIVAARKDQGSAIGEAFANLEISDEVIQQGSTKTSIRTAGGLQVDLRVVPQQSFGAALMYFTGSKEHNVRMRERAIARGHKLNEYGLYEGKKRIAGETEEEVFAALDLAWIPPELREDRGELDHAAKGPFTDLIVRDQIRAELHAHTDASDGKWRLDEYAEEASRRGYHTIAVTDHSVSQRIANGLSQERLRSHVETVRAAATRWADQLTILAGAEVDILSDGRLDYPDDLLAALDLVVASPHTALRQEDDKATTRLCRALENPYVTILGHPTGRLVNSREGMHPDMSAVLQAARERDIAMEINANHHRLDLCDTHARQAVEAGLKLAVNTDAHGAGDLEELRYGVLTARRAGARPGDVINCWGAEALRDWLDSK